MISIWSTWLLRGNVWLVIVRPAKTVRKWEGVWKVYGSKGSICASQTSYYIYAHDAGRIGFSQMLRRILQSTIVGKDLLCTRRALLNGTWRVWSLRIEETFAISVIRWGHAHRVGGYVQAASVDDVVGFNPASFPSRKCHKIALVTLG